MYRLDDVDFAHESWYLLDFHHLQLLHTHRQLTHVGVAFLTCDNNLVEHLSLHLHVDIQALTRIIYLYRLLDGGVTEVRKTDFIIPGFQREVIIAVVVSGGADLERVDVNRRFDEQLTAVLVLHHAVDARLRKQIERS